MRHERPIPVKHYCRVCGSFMGFTHEPGDVVVCSYAEDSVRCETYGWAEHPRDDAKRLPDTRGKMHRKWDI